MYRPPIRPIPDPKRDRSEAGTVHVLSALGLTLPLCATARANPPLPTIPNNTFNVTSYGAVGNGSTNDTTSIQDAINAAASDGGGTVIIPASSGGSYLCDPLTLASDINLEVNGELQMEPYGTYTGSGSTTSISNFISGSSLSNVEISGSGVIDGQGSPWWTAFNNNNSLARPQMIAISASTNVEIAGVTLQNAPNTHIQIQNSCSNVTISGITINSPASSPNTDGIDISANNALITNCNIADGDDNIAVGGTSPMSNIVVSNDTFGVGHGMSIGSITQGGLNGLTVTNCTFTGTTSGIRMKSNEGRGGLVENLTYSNITMLNVTNPIYIASYYPSLPNQPPDASGTADSTTPIWQNILISHLTATWNTNDSGSNTGIIWGLPYELIDGLTLNDVNITAANGMEIYYATGVDLNHSTFSPGNISEYDASVAVTVPEPGALKLMALGTGAIWISRRRRDARIVR
jgi:polygalacturonase